ncbi:unnamed protein product [Brassica rapa subsp. narinosa]
MGSNSSDRFGRFQNVGSSWRRVKYNLRLLHMRV